MKKVSKIIPIVLGIVFAVMVFTMPYDSPGQTKWFFLSCFCIGLIAWKLVMPKLGTAAALLFAYAVINGAWFWIWKNNRYINLGVMDPESGVMIQDAYTQLAVRHFASDGVAKLLIVLFPILFFLNDREKLCFWGSRLSATFCISTIGMVFYSLFFEPNWCRAINSCGGSLSNPSMNSSLLVVTLPFLLALTRGWVRWLCLILAVAAVFISKGSIGVGLLAAMACLYALRFGYWKLLYLGALSIAAGRLIYGPVMFNSGNRWDTWVFLMGKWFQNAKNYPFGMGYGTFGVFSANLQLAEGHDTNWWIRMHNDWLELLFTLGFVGLALSVLVYLTALLRFFARKEYTETISMCLFGLMMGMNYPLHDPIASLFGGFIVLAGLLISQSKGKDILDSSCHNC